MNGDRFQTSARAQALFEALCQHVGKQPDKRQRVHLTCPNCKRADKKFAFGYSSGLNRYYAQCFVCGIKYTLKALADVLGLPDNRPYSAPTAQVPRAPKPKPWQARAELLAKNFAQTPGNVQAWQKYKPVSADVIREHQLGFGEFPGGLWDSTREEFCHHRRLIVPLFDGDHVVGFRCRAMECQHTKWLSPGGTRLVLYNAACLRPGLELVAIAENPIDALLVVEKWHTAAVATLGVSVWNDDYTARLWAAKPECTLIGFDNDVPGQTINPRIIAEWKRRRREKKLPDDERKFLSGIKLANRLLAAGLIADYYRWPLSAPDGADLGSLFQETRVA